MDVGMDMDMDIYYVARRDLKICDLISPARVGLQFYEKCGSCKIRRCFVTTKKKREGPASRWLRLTAARRLATHRPRFAIGVGHLSRGQQSYPS